MKRNYFVSVDWGTSNFRLRLVEFTSLSTLEEIVNEKGVKLMNSLFLAQTEMDRRTFFLDFINEQLKLLKSDVSKLTKVVISGMPSSSIGLCELQYADTPFKVDGHDLYVENIESANYGFDVLMISGVKTNSDVMRGEEVQIVGLLADENPFERQVYVLPGTHSKHVFIENEKVVDFRTYMTGEMFNVISSHTILNDVLEYSSISQINGHSFKKGVLRSQEKGSLLNTLFGIRANHLIESNSNSENYAFLSGLLIGEELGTLKEECDPQILLCAGGRLFQLYNMAIDLLELKERTKVIPSDAVDISVVKGQKIILENQLKIK